MEAACVNRNAWYFGRVRWNCVFEYTADILCTNMPKHLFLLAHFKLMVENVKHLHYVNSMRKAKRNLQKMSLLCENCDFSSVILDFLENLSACKMVVIKYQVMKALITKTYLYNVDPLKPHIYIVKLGFTGVYIIFHISAQNIDCGYSLEPPRRGGSNEYHNLCFWADIRKIFEFLSEIFHILLLNFPVYLNRLVFVMLTSLFIRRVWSSSSL